MKFHLVPVGEKFEYQGEVYIKADKLIANSEKTGQNRLIPRSANVHTVSEQASLTPRVVEEHQVQTKTVLEEFDIFYQCCIDAISGNPDADTIKNKIETAKQNFVSKLVN